MQSYVFLLGWCSAQPRTSFDKFGMACRDLSVGDVCLPPDHADVVRTPDLCDRFRRFEFETQEASPTSHVPTTTSSSSTLVRPVAISAAAAAAVKNSIAAYGGSPPASPATPTTKGPKTPKEKDPDKPKRPMNGFMLFAKKYRLELIQQHPGKDNR